MESTLFTDISIPSENVFFKVLGLQPAEVYIVEYIFLEWIIDEPQNYYGKLTNIYWVKAGFVWEVRCRDGSGGKGARVTSQESEQGKEMRVDVSGSR